MARGPQNRGTIARVMRDAASRDDERRNPTAARLPPAASRGPPVTRDECRSISGIPSSRVTTGTRIRRLPRHPPAASRGLPVRRDGRSPISRIPPSRVTAGKLRAAHGGAGNVRLRRHPVSVRCRKPRRACAGIGAATGDADDRRTSVGFARPGRPAGRRPEVAVTPFGARPVLRASVPLMPSAGGCRGSVPPPSAASRPALAAWSERDRWPRPGPTAGTAFQGRREPGEAPPPRAAPVMPGRLCRPAGGRTGATDAGGRTAPGADRNTADGTRRAADGHTAGGLAPLALEVRPRC